MKWSCSTMPCALTGHQSTREEWHADDEMAVRILINSQLLQPCKAPPLFRACGQTERTILRPTACTQALLKGNECQGEP